MADARARSFHVESWSPAFTIGGVPVRLMVYGRGFDAAALSERVIEAMDALDPMWVCPLK